MFNDTLLDFDTVGSELINRRMNRQHATVYVCKDETNNDFRNTEAKLQALVHLSHA